jgi:Ca-activated chloride channel family protein
MPALPNVIASQKVCFTLLLLFDFLVTAAPAQTSLNDIHIEPIGSGSALASTVASTKSFGHVIRTDVNLVLVPVSVTDPNQRLVSGLGPENFQIFEGRKPQEIRHFSSEDAPVSVGIIMDASGSMSDKMNRVRDAVKQFCEAANLQDEFFMITFADQPRLAADFTTAPEDIEKELLFTQPKGRTSLLDAIYMGLGKMKHAKHGKKALLIISDGGDNHSRYSEKEVKTAAKESDVMIYAIGTFDRYVPTIEEFRGPGLLAEIAEPTGGRAYSLENAAELPTVARRISVELRTQYVLAYHPQAAAHDGKWHTIRVKLRIPKKWPFLQAHARTGYYVSGGG